MPEGKDKPKSLQELTGIPAGTVFGQPESVTPAPPAPAVRRLGPKNQLPDLGPTPEQESGNAARAMQQQINSAIRYRGRLEQQARSYYGNISVTNDELEKYMQMLHDQNLNVQKQREAKRDAQFNQQYGDAVRRNSLVGIDQYKPFIDKARLLKRQEGNPVKDALLGQGFSDADQARLDKRGSQLGDAAPVDMDEILDKDNNVRPEYFRKIYDMTGGNQKQMKQIFADAMQGKRSEFSERGRQSIAQQQDQTRLDELHAATLARPLYYLEQMRQGIHSGLFSTGNFIANIGAGSAYEAANNAFGDGTYSAAEHYVAAQERFNRASPSTIASTESQNWYNLDHILSSGAHMTGEFAPSLFLGGEGRGMAALENSLMKAGVQGGMKGAAARFAARAVGDSFSGRLMQNSLHMVKTAFPPVFSGYVEDGLAKGYTADQAVARAYPRALINTLALSVPGAVSRVGIRYATLPSRILSSATEQGQMRALMGTASQFIKGPLSGGAAFAAGSLADSWQNYQEDMAEGRDGVNDNAKFVDYMNFEQSKKEGLVTPGTTFEEYKQLPEAQQFGYGHAFKDMAEQAMFGVIWGSIEKVWHGTGVMPNMVQADYLRTAVNDPAQFNDAVDRTVRRGKLDAAKGNSMKAFVARIAPTVEAGEAMGLKHRTAVQYAVESERMKDLAREMQTLTDQGKISEVVDGNGKKIPTLTAQNKNSLEWTPEDGQQLQARINDIQSRYLESKKTVQQLSEGTYLKGRTVSGDEMVRISGRFSPGDGLREGQAAQIIANGPYRTEMMDLQRYRQDPQVQRMAAEMMIGEGESAKFAPQNQNPPVVDRNGNVIDGAKRIAYVIANGAEQLEVARPLQLAEIARLVKDETDNAQSAAPVIDNLDPAAADMLSGARAVYDNELAIARTPTEAERKAGVTNKETRAYYAAAMHLHEQGVPRDQAIDLLRRLNGGNISAAMAEAFHNDVAARAQAGEAAPVVPGMSADITAGVSPQVTDFARRMLNGETMEEAKDQEFYDDHRQEIEAEYERLATPSPAPAPEAVPETSIHHIAGEDTKDDVLAASPYWDKSKGELLPEFQYGQPGFAKVEEWLEARERGEETKAGNPQPVPAAKELPAPQRDGFVRMDEISQDYRRFHGEEPLDEKWISETGMQTADGRFDQPVKLWRDPADGQLYVLDGKNRLESARRMGWDHVNAEIREDLDLAAARQYAEATRSLDGREVLADGPVRFVTSDGKYFVSHNGTGLKVINRTTGKDAIGKYRSAAIEEAMSRYKFNRGLALDSRQIAELPTAADFGYAALESSANPAEVALAWSVQEAVPQQMQGAYDAQILEHISPILSTTNDYTRGDMEGLFDGNAGARMHWLTSDRKKGSTLSDIAHAVNESMYDGTGIAPERVTPDDILDFMKRHPAGVRGVDLERVSDSPLAQDLARKFERMTGFPLDKRAADMAMSQQRDSLSPEEQAIFDQEIRSYEHASQLYDDAVANGSIDPGAEDARNPSVEGASPDAARTTSNAAADAAAEQPAARQDGLATKRFGRVTVFASTEVIAQSGWTERGKFGFRALFEQMQEMFGTRMGVVITDNKNAAEYWQERGQQFEDMALVPNAWVSADLNTIHLNIEKCPPSAVMDELGHVWNGWARVNAPQIHEMGVKLAEGSAEMRYMDEYLSGETPVTPEGMSEGQADLWQRYADAYGLRENGRDLLIEEVLTHAIQNQGQMLAATADRARSVSNDGSVKKGTWGKWLESLWSAVRDASGFRRMTTREFSRITLDEFSRAAAEEIGRGKALTRKIKEAVDADVKRNEVRRKDAKKGEEIDESLQLQVESAGRKPKIETSEEGETSSVESGVTATVMAAMEQVSPSDIYSLIESANPRFAQELLDVSSELSHFKRMTEITDDYQRRLATVLDVIADPSLIATPADKKVMGGISGGMVPKVEGRIGEVFDTLARVANGAAGEESGVTGTRLAQMMVRLSKRNTEALKLPEFGALPKEAAQPKEAIQPAAAKPAAAKRAPKAMNEKRKSSLQNLDELLSLPVFHGSAYDFDNFSTDRIGTGEGKQAFGWGLYFTDSERIARYYASAVSRSRQKATDVIIDIPPNKWISFVKDVVSKDKGLGRYSDELGRLRDIVSRRGEDPLGREAQEALDFFANHSIQFEQDGRLNSDGRGDAVFVKKADRNLYNVSLHDGKDPSQYNYLLWDKPIPEDTFKRIQALPEAENAALSILDNAGTVYNKISRISGPEKTSKSLLSIGIDGVKYPAESRYGSRTSDNASAFNYVVFDDTAVSIGSKERFSLPEDPEKESKRTIAAMSFVADSIEDNSVSLSEIMTDVYDQMGDRADVLYPYIKRAYLAYQAEASDVVLDRMDDPRTVRAFDFQALKQQLNASDPESSLEPNSPRAAVENGVGQEDVQPANGPEAVGSDGARGQEVGAPQQEPEPASGNIVPDGDAPADGNRGDSALPDGASGAGESEAGIARGYDSRRSGWFGNEGQRPAERRAAGVVKFAQPGTKGVNSDKLALQRAAEAVPIIPTDRQNIAESLPYLEPSQHDDVAFLEKRFIKPDGYGALLANGTGTGKTFTALGAIKRMIAMGKTDGIIVVPGAEVMKEWLNSAPALGIELTPLKNKKDPGTGVSITTFANFGLNDAVFSRPHDFIVIDETHKIMGSSNNKETHAFDAARALTLHPDSAYDLAMRRDRATFNKLNDAREKIKGIDVDLISPEDRKEIEDLTAQWNDKVAQAKRLINFSQGDARPRAIFLSATPFAYRENVQWANGFLFEYPRIDRKGYYNEPNAYQAFMIQHFGYRMDHGHLTIPDANVDTDLMERNFNMWLRKQGSLSTRSLDLKADYERKFALTPNAVGTKIDEGLEFLRNGGDGKYNALFDVASKRFNYIQRSRLLEAIKAHEFIPTIQQLHALGRKVVVFFDYNEGGGFSPFRFDDVDPSAVLAIKDASGVRGIRLQDLAEMFYKERPDLAEINLDQLGSPIETLRAAFPKAAIVNGEAKNKKDRPKAIVDFNNDDMPDANLVIVQSQVDAGWSGHDKTGKFPRVLINLGQPTAPTRAIQQEGRIYRVGQSDNSNSLFLYGNTGTMWERYAFASKIAERAATAENLAMGTQARGLKRAFIEAFEESAPYTPSLNDGRGSRDADRARMEEMDEFKEAKTHYFAQQKKNARTKAMEGVDYFATPEPLGYKMVQWAQPRSGESWLEPSAGHGAIARFLPERTNRTIIEPSTDLFTKSQMNVLGARGIQDTFENLHISNKFDGIVMNPPFGTAGTTASEHVQKAVNHLRPGGRIVALVPVGMFDGKFEKWFSAVDQRGRPVHPDLHLTARIKMPASTFERAGTKVGTQILIIDRAADPRTQSTNATRNIDLSEMQDITSLFDRIEHMDMPSRPGHENATTAPAVMPVPEMGALSTPPSTPNTPAPALNTPPTPAVSGPVAAVQPAAKVKAPVKSFHTKSQKDIWVVERGRSLSDAEYAEAKQAASRHGGYWSSFKGGGAIPGFIFSTPEGAEAFHKELAATAEPASTATVPADYKLPAGATNEQKELYGRWQSAGERLVAAREKIASTRRDLDKRIMDDGANLFGERKATAGSMFDVRVDPAQRDVQLQPLQEAVTKAESELNELGQQLAESEGKASAQREMFSLPMREVVDEARLKADQGSDRAFETYMEGLGEEGQADPEALAARGELFSLPLSRRGRAKSILSVHDKYFIKEDANIGNRELAKMQAGEMARRFQEEIKSTHGEKPSGIFSRKAKAEWEAKWRDTDRAIHIYMDTLRNPAHIADFDKALADAKLKVNDPAATPLEIEKARNIMAQEKIVTLSQNLTKEQKDIADKIGIEYDKIGKLAINNGIIKDVIDNYVSRAWDFGAFSTEEANKFSTSTRHSMKRALDTILEGFTRGFKLKIEGASNNLSTLYREINNVIENQRLLEEGLNMKDEDGKPLFSVSSRRQDYQRIENKSFRKWQYVGRLSDYSSADRASFNRDTIVSPSGAVLRKMDVFAPKDIAKSLNNVLGSSQLNRVESLNSLTRFNANVKKSILSASVFHYIAFTRAHILGHSDWLKNPRFVSPRAAYRAGLELMAADHPLIQKMIQNGMTLGRMQDFTEGVAEHSSALGRKIDELGGFPATARKSLLDFNHAFHKHLFETYGAGLKAFDGIALMKKEMKKYPNENVDVIAKRVAKVMNDSYGGVNWNMHFRGNAFQNPTVRHLSSLLLLAPDWTTSNLRLFRNAFRNNEQGDLYRKMWAKVILRGLTLTAFANAALAAMDDSEEDEDWYDAMVNRYQKGWDAGHLRWTMVDITPLYHAVGGDPEKRSYFSVFGAYSDPLRMMGVSKDKAGNISISSQDFLSHKASFITRATLESFSGENWQHKQFTTMDELLGMDDKGEYKHTQGAHKKGDINPMTGLPYAKTQKAHSAGEAKGGKSKGSLTRYPDYGGGVSIWKRPATIPSYLGAQMRGMLPTALQSLMAAAAGENDWAQFAAQAPGTGVVMSKDPSK